MRPPGLHGLPVFVQIPCRYGKPGFRERSERHTAVRFHRLLCVRRDAAVLACHRRDGECLRHGWLRLSRMPGSRCGSGSAYNMVRINLDFFDKIRDIDVHDLRTHMHRLGGIVIVHVSCVANLYMRTRSSDPSIPLPSMIIHLTMLPIHVTIKPDADLQPIAKHHDGGEIAVALSSIYNLGIILGNVDEFSARRNDTYLTVIQYDDLLPGIRFQITITARLQAQALNRAHDIVRLIDIGLADRGHPFRLARQHGQY